MRVAGAVGVFLRTNGLKVQCRDPILDLYFDLPSSSDVLELEVVGNFDRTGCDEALTIAVMSSTTR